MDDVHEFMRRNENLILLLLNQTTCCGYSFEHLKHMLKIIDKKIFTFFTLKICFYLLKPVHDVKH